MDLHQYIKLGSALRKVNAADKDLWREEMYKNRWKNFFMVLVYIAVCVFFLWLGWFIKDKFFNIVYWFIWMILAGMFLLVGIYTMLSYLGMIIRGKK